MAGKYSLLFTPLADDDIDQIYQYITVELSAGIAADNLLEQLELQIMHLREFPYSHAEVSDMPLKGKGYRMLPVKNYFVFYKISEADKKVIIMRIIYNGRQYNKFL
jgi:toxin ParE1/3/4